MESFSFLGEYLPFDFTWWYTWAVLGIVYLAAALVAAVLTNYLEYKRDTILLATLLGPFSCALGALVLVGWSLSELVRLAEAFLWGAVSDFLGRFDHFRKGRK